MRKVSKAKAASAASVARQTRNASAESDNESVDSRVNGESDEEEVQEKTPSRKTKAGKRKGGRKASSDQESESDSHANGDAGEDADEADEADDADDADDDVKKPPKKAGRPSKKSQPESSDEEEYEVEDIIDSKREKGEVLYLIRWKGYSAANDTWEPESVVSCPKLLAAFHARSKGSKNKKSPSKSKGSSKRKSSDDDEKKKKRKKRSDLDELKRDFDYENADEKAEYEVEKIVEVHFRKNGGREFLIHWKGWSAVHDSWEPEKNLNCKELIAKFMHKVEQLKLEGPGAGGRTSSGLRAAPPPTQRFTLNPQSEARRLSRRSAHTQRANCAIVIATPVQF